VFDGQMKGTYSKEKLDPLKGGESGASGRRRKNGKKVAVLLVGSRRKGKKRTC